MGLEQNHEALNNVGEFNVACKNNQSFNLIKSVRLFTRKK